MASKKMNDQEIVAVASSYKKEARMAKFDRMQRNKINFDMYHLRQDFSYKQKGQSQEFLPKMSLAVEQNSNFIQQGLVDLGEWFRVYPSPGVNPDAMAFKPSEVQKLLQRHLEKNNIIVKIADSLKLGMIGSLMIAKVGGQFIPKPRYKAEKKMGADGKVTNKLVRIEDKAWELKIDLVRQEDFFIDPTGNGLYVMQDIYLDYYQVLQLAEQGLYDKEAVKQLKGQYSSEGYDREYYRNRETGQNATEKHHRGRVKLTEVWGNIINEQGELVYENVVFTIANDRILIQKPTENPLWHNEHPFVFAPILSVPHGVWGKALMDAPAMLNKAINEMFNLIVDGGMMSVHGIKQIREHYLEDPTQVDNGIDPGTTLRVNMSCPPGQQVIERVDSSTIPQDGLAVMNLLNQEHNAAALTNDLRMGVAPFRSVKATEIVEASQSITGMFAGIAKQAEAVFVTKLLEKCWKMIAQHTEELDQDSLKALFGSKRAEMIFGTSNESLFADTVAGCKFEVFGISATLAKQKNFTKLQGLLQTVGTSPVMMEEFVKKYDFGKLLKEIMESLDINTAKLEHDMEPAPRATGGNPLDTTQGGADMQSQIPQAGAAGNQGDLSAIPQTEFPESRATSVANPAAAVQGG